MDIKALSLVTLTGALYAASLIASRYGVGEFNPFLFNTLRIIFTGASYGIVYLFGRRWIKWPSEKRTWKHAILVGILDTAVPMTLFILAIQYQSSGVTSILVSLFPVFILVLAHFFLPDERLNFQKSVGALLALVGAVILTVRGESGLPGLEKANPLGYIFTLSAIAISSVMTVYARRFMQDLNPVHVTSIRMWVAGMLLIPLGLIVSNQDLRQVTTLGYISMGVSALAGPFMAFMLSFYIIKRFGATTVAMTTYISPVFASIGGMLLLGEIITIGMIGGMVLIITGIVIINQRITPKAF
jgi:drug/metabolite transporter (DMT)-like permease